MYQNGAPLVGPGVLGVGLARTGFPALGLGLLALVLVIAGLMLLRAATVRRGS